MDSEIDFGCAVENGPVWERPIFKRISSRIAAIERRKGKAAAAKAIDDLLAMLDLLTGE